MRSWMNISLFSLLATVVAVNGCASPAEMKLESYSTKEDISASQTVVIAEFSLKCKDGATDVNLFAEIGERSLAVGRSSDGNTYQVSWSDAHKNIAAGEYVLRIYDEAGHSALRKAQRAGESVEGVKPLATAPIQHQGVWKGAWISSETVACIVTVLVWYFAYSTKSCIMS